MSRLKKEAMVAAAAGADEVVHSVIRAAEQELREDVATNRAIGQRGAQAVLKHTAGRPARVLTHCNTGTLATAGYGTALGVIRALHSTGALAAVYCTETRPYNQGARLTAYELVHDGLQPATLICDSAAAALMADGAIDAVIVGADRVAANGDTANKVGTYALAVAAAYHDVPFFVAAPRSTMDPETPHGDAIHIEQRPAEEVTHSRSDGARVAPEGIAVWNPCFDVTPAKLITGGIITEDTVLLPQTHADGGVNFEVTGRPSINRTVTDEREASIHKQSRSEQPLDVDSVLEYIASRPALVVRLGGLGTRDTWRAREVGDGNINFIFMVTSGDDASRSLVVKQALPYIRLVGERWPLTQERIAFEVRAMRKQHELCPEHVPEVFSWDEARSLIIMRYIEPPHVMLRAALTAGRCFPRLAEHIGHFLGNTLFATSPYALGGAAFRREMHAFGCNADMCALTQKVILTDPYDANCKDNRHTSPQLDADVAELRDKVSMRELMPRFVTKAEALLHGDLHTGSCMVTENSTFVFDAEFAFYGPIGFDVGLFIANLLLAYFAAAADQDRRSQRDWLLQCARDTWDIFSTHFMLLWRTHGHADYKMIDPEQFMADVFRDTFEFAAAEMIRRIVGIAHVEDFERIQNPDSRARCERMALECARHLLDEAVSCMPEKMFDFCAE